MEIGRIEDFVLQKARWERDGQFLDGGSRFLEFAFVNLVYDSNLTYYTAQKMKFSMETADLVTFTEEILNGKRHFWCSAFYVQTERSYITCYFLFMFYLSHFIKSFLDSILFY